MVKFFTNMEELDNYIDEFVSQQPYNPARIYVIMRYGYTEHELNNETYTVELLQYYDDEYVWINKKSVAISQPTILFSIYYNKSIVLKVT